MLSRSYVFWGFRITYDSACHRVLTLFFATFHSLTRTISNYRSRIYCIRFCITEMETAYLAYSVVKYSEC